eukprot:7092744-Pyramimonas_sp.AAC.1
MCFRISVGSLTVPHALLCPKTDHAPARPTPPPHRTPMESRRTLNPQGILWKRAGPCKDPTGSLPGSYGIVQDPVRIL